MFWNPVLEGHVHTAATSQNFFPASACGIKMLYGTERVDDNTIEVGAIEMLRVVMYGALEFCVSSDRPSLTSRIAGSGCAGQGS
eukprot:1125780-Rhodomonas_salina.3